MAIHKHCSVQQAWSLHALLESISLPLEEKEAEGKVCYEDEDQRDHDGRRGRLAHALGAAGGGEAPGTAHLRVQAHRFGLCTEIKRWPHTRNAHRIGYRPCLSCCFQHVLLANHIDA